MQQNSFFNLFFNLLQYTTSTVFLVGVHFLSLKKACHEFTYVVGKARIKTYSIIQTAVMFAPVLEHGSG